MTKVWKDNSMIEKSSKQFEVDFKETKQSLDHMMERGYIKRFWDKNLKTWKYQHTPKGVEWNKNRKENQHD